MSAQWRLRSRQVIAQVVADNPGKTPEELLKLIDAAYPFGPRKHWPYTQWLKARREWRENVARGTAEGPLSRACTACGARIGEPCRQYVNPRAAGDDAAWPIGSPRPTLDEVHEARANPPSGPLFGDA